MLITFLIFGVPHGSLDLFIEGGMDEKKDKRKVFFRYVATVAVYGLVWYVLPEFALIVFIMITAFHFGEIDWVGEGSKLLNKSKYFVLGMCWILFLLSSHLQEALNVFDAITRRQVEKTVFIDLAQSAYVFSIAGMLGMFVFLYFDRRNAYSDPRLFYFALIQHLFLFILSNVMPLWFFFAFYFGIWHSVLSLDKIRKYIGMGNTLPQWMKLIKLSLPFSVLAWIGIVYFILLTSKMDDKAGMLSIVFIGLSVLTLPHLQIFTKLNKR
jgi:Brp/Blh family beta-carotene 15,15'-monooxygenase